MPPARPLHSNLVEMARWVVAHLDPAQGAASGPSGEWVRLDPGLRDLMWRPVAPVGRPPAWTMTGWAHQVDGRPDLAATALRRALDLDPENDEAAQLLGGRPSA